LLLSHLYAAVKPGLLACLTLLALPAAVSATAAPAPATIEAAAPLPIALKATSGLAASPGALLRWATASEANTARFVVERSADGLAFEAIGAVAAAGTSSAPRAYRFDDVADPAVAYYRLRQENQDGTVAYSAAVIPARASGVAAR